MDWLKDKKNQPIIAIAAAVIIVGVLVFVLRPMIFGGGSSGDTGSDAPAADTSGAQMSTDPNMAPPGTPAATPAAVPAGATPAQSGTQTAQASNGPTPMEKWRSDPFLPVGYKPPKKQAVRKLPIMDFPFPRIPIPKKDDDIVQIQDTVQPVRRMAGLLLNNRVYAIIEQNGTTQIVQPGTMLNDHLAIVEKIEQDKVILKTTGKNPRYLIVRMASSPEAQSAVDTTTPANAPAIGMPGAGTTGGTRNYKRPPAPGM